MNKQRWSESRRETYTEKDEELKEKIGEQILNLHKTLIKPNADSKTSRQTVGSGFSSQ